MDIAALKQGLKHIVTLEQAIYEQQRASDALEKILMKNFEGKKKGGAIVRNFDKHLPRYENEWDSFFADLNQQVKKASFLLSCSFPFFENRDEAIEAQKAEFEREYTNQLHQIALPPKPQFADNQSEQELYTTWEQEAELTVENTTIKEQYNDIANQGCIAKQRSLLFRNASIGIGILGCLILAIQPMLWGVVLLFLGIFGMITAQVYKSNSKKVESEAAILRKKYEDTKRSYVEKRKKEYDAERANQKQQIREWQFKRSELVCKAFQEALDKANKVYLEKADFQYQEVSKELANISMSIIECKSTLERLYSTCGIYEKYHSWVPASMFLEYLQSGRCDSLDGAHGCYNLYEMELRQNIIIDKIDAISQQLDRVITNQTLIFRAMQETNYRLRKIEGRLDNTNSLLASMFLGLEKVNQTTNELLNVAHKTMYTSMLSATYNAVTAANTGATRYIRIYG